MTIEPLARRLPAGLYRGTVDGIESGHCTARIRIQTGPSGCRIVDYEATSTEHGLQHVEHGILTVDELHLAFGEAPGVTVFRASADGVYASTGDRPMRIHVGYDGDVLTWAWHWGAGVDDLVERSRASCVRADC